MAGTICNMRASVLLILIGIFHGAATLAWGAGGSLTLTVEDETKQQPTITRLELWRGPPTGKTIGVPRTVLCGTGRGLGSQCGADTRRSCLFLSHDSRAGVPHRQRDLYAGKDQFGRSPSCGCRGWSTCCKRVGPAVIAASSLRRTVCHCEWRRKIYTWPRCWATSTPNRFLIATNRSSTSRLGFAKTRSTTTGWFFTASTPAAQSDAEQDLLPIQRIVAEQPR